MACAAGPAPVAGVSSATANFMLLRSERDVEIIKDNLAIALEYEDLIVHRIEAMHHK